MSTELEMLIPLMDCIRLVKDSFERGIGREAKNIYLGDAEYEGANAFIRRVLKYPDDVKDPIAERTPYIHGMKVHHIYSKSYLSVSL